MEENLHLNSDEDVEAILRLAVQQQGQDTGDLRQRLEASAAELGISPENLLKAEEAYREIRAREEQEAVARAEAKKARALRVRGLVGHWIPFLAVNAFLHFINFRFSPGSYWAMWPLFGWGMGMMSHTWAVLSSDERELAEDEKAEQRRHLEKNLRSKGYQYTVEGDEVRVHVGRRRE